MSVQKEIPLRKYARFLFIRHRAVQKALAANKIQAGWNDQTKKIVLPDAYQEYKGPILPAIEKVVAAIDTGSGVTAEQLLTAIIERVPMLQAVGVLASGTPSGSFLK